MTDHDATAERIVNDYWADRSPDSGRLVVAIAAALAEISEDRDIYKRYWDNTAKETQERGNEIAQLRAKLAEAERESHHWEDMYQTALNDCVRLKAEVEQSKAGKPWTHAELFYCGQLLKTKLAEAEVPDADFYSPTPNRKVIFKTADLLAERDAAEAKGFVRGLERATEIVKDEPEYPGTMPEEMWLAVKGDRNVMAETMRITVRLTKSNIDRAIAAEIAKAGKP